MHHVVKEKNTVTFFELEKRKKVKSLLPQFCITVSTDVSGINLELPLSVCKGRIGTSGCF